MPYIFPLLWSLFAAINNTLRKKTVIHVDTNLILVYQYVWIVIWSLGMWLIYAQYNNSNFLPSIDIMQWIFIISISIIGYIGIMFFVKALQHAAGGIVSLIANTSVFLMFLLNRYLFPQKESISIFKIILSIMFFMVVWMFLLKEWHGDNAKSPIINKYLLYPIWTSLCRAYFFVSNNYLIQYHILDPIQTVRVTEVWVMICATIYYFLKWWTVSKIKSYCKEWISTNIILLWLTSMLSWVFFYLWYQEISANIVNTIRLSTIILTAFFCRLLLWDKISTKQIVLLCIWMFILIIFMFS